MMYAVLLVLSFLASVMGSLPISMVNLSVLKTTHQYGNRQGLRFALGVAFVEMFQVFLALNLSRALLRDQIIKHQMEVWTAVVVGSLGLFFLLRRDRKVVEDIGAKPPLATWMNRHRGLLKGVAIQILNPLSIPFWFFFRFGYVPWALMSREEFRKFCSVLALRAGRWQPA